MRPTDRRFTGQRWEASLGLYDYRARFYDPALGRFLQPDPLVPEPGNPQALNRYAYVYHNPLRYIDGDGHLPVVPLLVAGAILALKVVDYGWTAYEAWHSLRVMNDPHASPEARAEAAANLALTAAFEAGEPEELLPISLPLDDLARVGLIGGVKRMGKEVGEEATERLGKEAGEGMAAALKGRFVRETLSPLPEPYRSAFEGEPVLRTLQPGQKLYRAEAIDQSPGRWFGTQPTHSLARAERWWNILKYGPRDVLRVYEVIEPITVYYGKVAGGRGTQILLPLDVDPMEVVRRIEEWPLK